MQLMFKDINMGQWKFMDFIYCVIDINKYLKAGVDLDFLPPGKTGGV